MDLSVSIVSWNTKDLLDQCLGSIFESAKELEFEVIVVDNASSDGSVAMVRGKYPQVRVIDNSENVGFAEANNQACAAGSGRYLMLLNPDTTVLDDLAVVVRFMDADVSIGAAGCRCLNPDGTIQENWNDYYPSLLWEVLPIEASRFLHQVVKRRNPDKPFDTKWVGGQCMTVRRETVEIVGGMDPEYFMYSEETDWCYRIRRAGWRVCHYPGLTVVHYGGQSTAQCEDQMFVQLYRSKARFIRKHQSASRCRLFLTGLYLRGAAHVLWLGMCRLAGKGDARKMRQQRLLMAEAFHL